MMCSTYHSWHSVSFEAFESAREASFDREPSIFVLLSYEEKKKKEIQAPNETPEKKSLTCPPKTPDELNSPFSQLSPHLE